MTKEQILKSAKENNVEFVRLQFTDLFGIMKNVSITVSQLEKALDNEIMFDGSSIDGFVRIDESDMYLHPDYDTWAIVPWRKYESIQTGRLICSVYKSDNKTPFEGDPRNVLQKVIDKAADVHQVAAEDLLPLEVHEWTLIGHCVAGDITVFAHVRYDGAEVFFLFGIKDCIRKEFPVLLQGLIPVDADDGADECGHNIPANHLTATDVCLVFFFGAKVTPADGLQLDDVGVG